MRRLATVLALCAGCAADSAPDSNGDSSPRPPKLQVLLTDAPGDFDAVWVNIASVAVESAGEWKMLAETPQRFDLLTLQNDVTAALGDAELEPGTYGQLRLMVDSASVVVDGTESPLQIASGAQTGIKINLDQAIEPDTTYALTLDFDASKSVKTTGQGFLMTPVIMVKDFTATPMPAPEEPSSSDPQ